MSRVDSVFPWTSLSAILGGRSTLDAPRLLLAGADDAQALLLGYGFDHEQPEHRRELASLRVRALTFMSDELLADEPSLAIPDELLAETDVRQLLVRASGRGGELQLWACALLRVMHTLTHASSYFNERFGPEIRSQVFGRFEAHLEREATGLRLGHGDDSVALADYDIKYAKSLHSVATKLLHKPENVATDVFDRLGVRLVTRDRLDVLRVIRYLWLHKVVIFANVKPSRTRNSLFVLDAIDRTIGELSGYGDLDERVVLGAIRDALDAQAPPAAEALNPYSSTHYHAVQFSCRQMIRVHNPYPQTSLTPESAIPDPDTVVFTGGPELRFFYPFEVQIMDLESYEKSRTGLASHGDYKARQRAAVKERVLGRLLRPG